MTIQSKLGRLNTVDKYFIVPFGGRFLMIMTLMKKIVQVIYIDREIEIEIEGQADTGR